MVVFDNFPKLHQVNYSEFIQYYGPIMFKKFCDFQDKCLYNYNDHLPYMKIKFYTKAKDAEIPITRYEAKEIKINVLKEIDEEDIDVTITQTIKQYDDYKDSPEYKEKMKDKQERIKESARVKYNALVMSIEKRLIGGNYKQTCEHTPKKVKEISKSERVVNIKRQKVIEVKEELVIDSYQKKTIELGGLEFDDIPETRIGMTDSLDNHTITEMELKVENKVLNDKIEELQNQINIKNAQLMKTDVRILENKMKALQDLLNSKEALLKKYERKFFDITMAKWCLPLQYRDILDINLDDNDDGKMRILQLQVDQLVNVDGLD